MSVIIKGIRAPINCQACFLQRIGTHCINAERFLTFEEWNSINRPEWCPLGEIPTPHGRLIDADALLEANAYRTGKGILAINAAPTVIEAEGKE